MWLCIHIFAGGHAVELLEDGGEGGGVVETAGIHDFGDVHVLHRQQLGSLLQTDVADEVMGCLTCQLLHLAMQVDTRDAYLLGYAVDAEVGVADVLVDDLHDSIEQLVVGRLHLHLVYLFLQLVVAAVLQAQHLVGMDEVDDGSAQDV